MARTKKAHSQVSYLKKLQGTRAELDRMRLQAERMAEQVQELKEGQFDLAEKLSKEYLTNNNLKESYSKLLAERDELLAEAARGTKSPDGEVLKTIEGLWTRIREQHALVRELAAFANGMTLSPSDRSTYVNRIIQSSFQLGLKG